MTPNLCMMAKVPKSQVKQIQHQVTVFANFWPIALSCEIRQFILYYAHSLVHLSKQTTDQASDVPSIIFFLNFLQNSLQKSFQFTFFYIYFFNFTNIKIKIKNIESIRNYEKK